MSVAGYLRQLAIYMWATVPVWCVIRVCLLHKKRVNAFHEAGLLVFACFLAGLAAFTVLPQNGFLDSLESMMGYTNFVPFKVFGDSLRLAKEGNLRYAAVNVGGNILMFWPIGFFLPLLWGKRFCSTVRAGFLVSLAIELLQFPQPRWTDIDDLWLNTLGAACGYAVFWLFGKLAPRWQKAFLWNAET